MLLIVFFAIPWRRRGNKWKRISPNRMWLASDWPFYSLTYTCDHKEGGVSWQSTSGFTHTHTVLIQFYWRVTESCDDVGGACRDEKATWKVLFGTWVRPLVCSPRSREHPLLAIPNCSHLQRDHFMKRLIWLCSDLIKLISKWFLQLIKMTFIKPTSFPWLPFNCFCLLHHHFGQQNVSSQVCVGVSTHWTSVMAGSNTEMDLQLLYTWFPVHTRQQLHH